MARNNIGGPLSSPECVECHEVSLLGPYQTPQALVLIQFVLVWFGLQNHDRTQTPAPAPALTLTPTKGYPEGKTRVRLRQAFFRCREKTSTNQRNNPHVGQIDQIDHDLDHLDPKLPL